MNYFEIFFNAKGAKRFKKSLVMERQGASLSKGLEIIF